MTRRWLKWRKRLVVAILPVLRAVSPQAAARVLAGIGQAERVLISGSRVRHDEAVRRWSHHFGARWDVPRLARGLAGNEVRWQARDLLLDGVPESRLETLFRVGGLDDLDTARAEGRGVVLLASHFGSHLMPLHWLLRRGYPVRVYMERPNLVSRFLARHFADDGPLGQSKLFISRSYTAAESAASIMRAVKILRAGMVLCLAGDVRWSGPNTAPARFLGEEQTFTATWVVLASLTGAPVVPVFCRMSPGGTYDLEFRPAFHIPTDVVARREVPHYVQSYLDTVEEQLRLDPTNGNEYATWPVAPPRVPGASPG